MNKKSFSNKRVRLEIEAKYHNLALGAQTLELIQ